MERAIAHLPRKRFILSAIIIFAIGFILTAIVLFVTAFIPSAQAANISNPSQLGGYNHYNGIIFDYFESSGADVEGALAIGGESKLGTSGQFDIGAAASSDYSYVAIGSYDNPN